MSISNQVVKLFNKREVEEIFRVLLAKDTDAKLLVLEVLTNTDKRFTRKDSKLLLSIINKNVFNDLAVSIRVNYLKLSVVTSPENISYNYDYDKTIYSEQNYAFNLIEKVKVLHKHGFGKIETEKNKYKKKEYRRSATKHYL